MSLIEKALKQAEKERRHKDVYWEILTSALSPASQKKSSRIFFLFFFLPFLSLITYFSYLAWKYPPELSQPLSLKSITVRHHPPPLPLTKKEDAKTLLPEIKSSLERKTSPQSSALPEEKGGTAKRVPVQPWGEGVRESSPAQQARDLSPQQPNLARLHFDKGKELLSQGNYAGAREEFNTSLVLNPFNPEARNNLGIIFQKEGDLLKAEEELLKALAQNPSSEKILNNLGLNCYLRGKWDKSISYYQSALRINPANLATYTNLSLLYKKLNDLEKAEAMLEKALSLNPGHPEALYNLAVLLEGRGEKEKAIGYYQRFIDSSGSSYQELTEKVKRHLNDLQG